MKKRTGRTAVWLDEVDSTNAYALAQIDALPDRVGVFASAQTAGRGRRGKTWESPRNVNVYFSFLLKKPPFPAAAAAWLGGLAALDALREEAPDQAFWIKWPNDIYLENRKLAGVLCETRATAGAIDGVVIGVGVNLNMTAKQLAAIDRPATSLLVATGRRVDVRAFALRLHEILDAACAASFSLGTTDAIYKRWKSENALIGRFVNVRIDHRDPFDAQAVDIAETGDLIVLAGDGTRRAINAADVGVIPDPARFPANAPRTMARG